MPQKGMTQLTPRVKKPSLTATQTILWQQELLTPIAITWQLINEEPSLLQSLWAEIGVYKIWFLWQVGKGAIIAQQQTLVHRPRHSRATF